MTSRTQTVTDAEVEALARVLERGHLIAPKVQLAAAAMTLRTLLTDRAAHAQAVAQARDEALREAAEAVVRRAYEMGRQECCGCGVQSGYSAPECCGDPHFLVTQQEAESAILALIPTPSTEPGHVE